MRYWLTAIAAAVLTIAAGWFFLLNQGETLVRVTPSLTIGAPLGAALLAAFALGAAVVGLLAAGGAVARGWRATGARRRARRDARGQEVMARAEQLVWAGEMERARARLLRAPDDTASEVARIALLAETHLQDGEPAQAREVLERAQPASAGDPRILELLARAAEALGNRPAAIDALEHARRAVPGSPRLAMRLRDLYAAEGRWQDAASLQAEVLLGLRVPARLAAERETLVGLRYQACLQDEDPGRAAVRLRRLARESPDFIPAWVSAGDCYAQTARGSTARRVWVRGLRHRPAAILLDRVEAYDAAAGQPQRTTRLLHGVARRHAQPAFLRLRLARHLLTHGGPDQAAAVLDELTGASSPAFHALRGEIARLRGDAPAAVEALTRALGADLGLGAPWRCMGCGGLTPGWAARCPTCDRWDTLRAGAEEPGWSAPTGASDPLIRPAN